MHTGTKVLGTDSRSSNARSATEEHICANATADPSANRNQDHPNNSSGSLPWQRKRLGRPNRPKEAEQTTQSTAYLPYLT